MAFKGYLSLKNAKMFDIFYTYDHLKFHAQLRNYLISEQGLTMQQCTQKMQIVLERSDPGLLRFICPNS